MSDLKILFATSECELFAKTGGLGDVAFALPKQLALNENIDIRVVMPKYKSILEKVSSNFTFVTSFNVEVGWRNQYCGIFMYKMNNVTYYFIDNEYYFNRDNLYGYYDDGERFAFFDRAVIMMLEEVDFKADIIHGNDWQCGMIPALLNIQYKDNPFYSNIKYVYSIHNLLFQGNYDKNVLPDLFNIDLEYYHNGILGFDNGVSYMKAALMYSTKILTVSKTYAEEIKMPYLGEKMDGLLRERSEDFFGIVNGIDYSLYNPETDSLIYENYSLENIEDKHKNKLALQKELGLPVRSDIPMIGIVSRLTGQKGVDIIRQVGEYLLQQDIQFVILGTGDYEYEEYFKYLQYKYPNKVSANIKFNKELSHKIYAASDIFLMPSLFEPCGLGQLIALRYGSVPVVRETGGLKDTIIPYNKYTGEGNGFSFRNYNSIELYDCLQKAIAYYQDEKVWNDLVKSAIESNNSWEKSAKVYEELYLSIL